MGIKNNDRPERSIDATLQEHCDKIKQLDPETVNVLITDSPVTCNYIITLYDHVNSVAMPFPYEYFYQNKESAHPLMVALSEAPSRAEAFIRKFYGLEDESAAVELSLFEKADYLREKLDKLNVTPEHDLVGCINEEGIHIAAFIPRHAETIKANKISIPVNMVHKLLGKDSGKHSSNLSKLLFAYKMSKENQNGKNS